jgi:chemosensory pili system protein ChpA (sensor histidine kinase/response regulator)
VNMPNSERIEVFSQVAFEHLQFLREYAGVLQDPYPAQEALEHLYQAARALQESAVPYGLPLFSEVAGKLAHLFHYALNTTISPDACGAIVEFIWDGVAILESDLLMFSANGIEALEDVAAFKEKHPFAFQGAPSEPEPISDSVEPLAAASDAAPNTVPAAETAAAESLPSDGDVPEEILEFFVPEAEEHLQAVTECLLALEANANAEDVHRLFRAMHTVKGSAAQVGLQRIAHVAHRVEDLVGRLRDGVLRPSAEIVDVCLEAVDALKKFLYRQWPDEQTVLASVGSLLARIARLAPENSEILPAAEEPAPATPQTEFAVCATQEVTPVEAECALAPELEIAEVMPVAEAIAAAVPAQPRELAATPQSKSVRVPLERLDRMMNAVGELVINRTRMLGRLGELERLAEVLNFSKARMTGKIGEFQERFEFTRLFDGFSGMPALPFQPELSARFSLTTPFSETTHGEFSELEMDRYDEFNILSRSLSEISADITEVLTQLGHFVRQVDADMDEFTKLAHRLQDEITQARMVPIGNLYTRLSRTARDAAKASGKQVELTLDGAETELDNNIIQQISDPLIHLVRNSVAHGIETSQERTEAGKPAHGQLAVRAYHRGNQIYIEVEDDGRGIDYEKVRATAIAQGHIASDSADRLSERDLLEFLFLPGFSTASRKTELAGRGVGLDVVRANLSALNGEITIDTVKGVGTRFTLKVPLTLIITQALFLRSGSCTFGIPLAFVEEIRRLRSSDIEVVGSKQLTRVRDVVTEIVRLDTRLGLEPVEPINGFYRLVIVNVAGRQVGLVVEEVLRKDEIVIKGLGEYLRNIKLFPGATIAPDGTLILLLDVTRLVSDDMRDASRALQSLPVGDDGLPVERAKTKSPEKVIVLADDSISIRRFVGRMLEKAGYRVKYASDGLEALEEVTQSGCDLVITDLEMPRTNGFELMTHLRQNAATRNIPVLVLTSRAGAKHREKALKEGAKGFLAKPVQEDQLLAAVSPFFGATPADSKAATLETTGSNS